MPGVVAIGAGPAWILPACSSCGKPPNTRGLSNRNRAVGIREEISLFGSYSQGSHVTQHGPS